MQFNILSKDLRSKIKDQMHSHAVSGLSSDQTSEQQGHEAFVEELKLTLITIVVLSLEQSFKVVG